MLQVSRDGSLKIPKEVEQVVKVVNSVDDEVESKISIAMANDKKINEKKILEQVEDFDRELESVSKIPFNSNDLIVITKVKKLCAYVIAITEKSPKRFRGVFVNRMQNYCLDVLEDLLQANFIRLDSDLNKKRREDFQKEAIVKLKMLGYIAMVAESSGCILRKQYRQISLQTADAINLIVAWKKSDDKRFRK